MTVGLGVFWSLLYAQYLEEYLAYHSHLLKEGLHRESDWSVSSLNVDCMSVCDTTGETLQSPGETTRMAGTGHITGQDLDSITAPRMGLELDHWAERERCRHHMKKFL